MEKYKEYMTKNISDGKKHHYLITDKDGSFFHNMQFENEIFKEISHSKYFKSKGLRFIIESKKGKISSMFDRKTNKEIENIEKEFERLAKLISENIKNNNKTLTCRVCNYDEFEEYIVNTRTTFSDIVKNDDMREKGQINKCKKCGNVYLF